jgi:CRP-like cAMP-binding protein
MSSCNVDDKFLYTHSLFGGLTVEELGYIKTYFTEENYQPGDLILKQGEPNNRIFFIVEGEVQVFKHVNAAESEEEDISIRPISTLTTGDTFGEMELIDIQPCAASVKAITPTKIITFTNYNLYQLSKRHIKTYAMIIMNLAREISRRLRKTDEDLAYLLYKEHKNHT